MMPNMAPMRSRIREARTPLGRAKRRVSSLCQLVVARSMVNRLIRIVRLTGKENRVILTPDQSKDTGSRNSSQLMVFCLVLPIILSTKKGYFAYISFFRLDLLYHFRGDFLTNTAIVGIVDLWKI